MSKRTRCQQCHHTPGEGGTREPRDKTCGCVCHQSVSISPDYRPTPPTRPGWPRANPTHQMPLVIRTYPVHPTGNDFWSYQDKGTGREMNPFLGLRTRGKH